jgi:tetratricopeptide (TPR) repeat protein
MKKSMVFIVIILIPCTVFAGGLSGKIKEGNKYYNDANYNEALIKYNDAQIEDPSAPEVLFNMGNVFYRQKKYQEAADAFQKSMERGDIELEAKALYNIGNSFFQQGNFQEALEYYKQSLERDAEDVDTKYNIEYTERKIKEMMKRSPQTEQQAKQDRKKQQQQQQQQQGGKGEEEGDKKEQQNAQAGQKDGEKKQGEEQDKEKQGKSGKQKGSKKELSKEEAERVMSEFEQDQKKFPPLNQQDAQKARGSYVEKDW